MLAKNKYRLFSFFSPFRVGAFLFFLPLGPGFLFSQSLAPMLINSTGNSSSAGGIFISSSVGEPMVTTASSGSLTLTQGFQQTFLVCTPIAGFTVTPSGPICAGTNITITPLFSPSGATSYSWSTGQTTSSISLSPLGAAVYSVTITSGKCADDDTITVSVTPRPSPSISATPGTICQGQSVALTAGGGTTYQWSGGPASAAYNPTPPSAGTTTYSVSVANGTCFADTFIAVLVNPLPLIAATATKLSVCPGDTVVLIASGNATSYQWSGGPAASTYTVTPLLSTVYSVTGTDGNSCTNISTVSITENSITVNAGADITICPGYTANLVAVAGGATSGATYHWSNGNFLNDSTSQNPSASPDTTTLFVVVAKNGSCNSRDSITVYTIRTPECIIYIYNGITPNGDGNNDSWFIDGIQAYPKNNVMVFNRWGSKVWGGRNYNNKDMIWKGTDQQGQALPDGTYYYVIELYDTDGTVLYSASKWVEVTR